MFARGQLALFGQIPCCAKGFASRHDGNFDERVAVLQQPTDGGVSGFVEGDVAFLLLCQYFGLFLQSADDTVNGIEEILFFDGRFVVAGGYKCGFVAHVGDVGARKSRRLACQEVDVDRCTEFQWFQVHFEYLFAFVHIGQFHMYLAVETSGPQQCFVQNVGAVGGCQYDDATVGTESVHFGK